jgi:hypothetical protein
MCHILNVRFYPYEKTVFLISAFRGHVSLMVCTPWCEMLDPVDEVMVIKRALQ